MPKYLIAQKLKTLKKNGLKWCFFCKGYSLFYAGLQKIYRFDPWHSGNPIGCRPYKRHVSVLVNNLNPKSVVEVGCGLGDIIVNINSAERYGIDLDGAVIKCAKLLHPLSKIRWVVGDLSDLSLVPGTIDVLLAIGWVHLVSPEYLKTNLVPHLNRVNYIILDKFTDWNPPFEHDFLFLEGFANCIKVSTPENDSIRQYFVYKVIQQ